ncbi:MAG: hypothetical protein N2111_10560 [Candidatus Sumerlaeaceae bacterium]|nr:hypothetical protein [Candidatus Sumerlaeaceae bacterium]
MSLRATTVTVVTLIMLALIMALVADWRQSSRHGSAQNPASGPAPSVSGSAGGQPTFLFGNAPRPSNSSRGVREYNLPASPTIKQPSAQPANRQAALSVARLRALYDLTSDPFERAGLAAAMAECPSADAGHQLLDLIAREEDGDVRLALLRALAQWPGRAELAAEISVALRARFAAIENDLSERVAVLDTLGELPDAAAASLLEEVAFDPASDPSERAAAAASLLRQYEAGWPGAARLDAHALRTALALDAQAAADVGTRMLAVSALAISPTGHEKVFHGLLKTESDSGLRRMLQHLADE